MLVRGRLVPEAYLADYYTVVQPDEIVTMSFLVEAAAVVGDVPELLEFGCGPTVHHLLPFAARAAQIDVVDFLDQNLHAVRRWVDGADGDMGLHAVDEVHGGMPSSGASRPGTRCASAKATTRERIRSLGLADVRRPQPLRRDPGGTRSCCAASAPTR